MLCEIRGGTFSRGLLCATELTLVIVTFLFRNMRTDASDVTFLFRRLASLSNKPPNCRIPVVNIVVSALRNLSYHRISLKTPNREFFLLYMSLSVFTFIVLPRFFIVHKQYFLFFSCVVLSCVVTTLVLNCRVSVN